LENAAVMNSPYFHKLKTLAKLFSYKYW